MILRKLSSTYRTLAAGMLLFGGLVAVSPPAIAADAQNSTPQITMSPGSQKIVVAPGDTYRGSFKIFNFGESEFTFDVYGRPYAMGQAENYLEDSFEEGSERSSVFRWLQFDQATWVLKPGDEVRVNYTMTVPQDASPGGNYGVIFAETKPPEAQEGTAISTNSRLGHILQVEVEGDVVRSGNYLETKIDFLQPAPPLKVTTRVQNDGNVHDDATVSVTIKDIFGNEKFSETKTYIVYPETTRAMTVEWPDANWVGLYKVEAETTFLDTAGQESKWVLIMPGWMIVVLILAVIGGGYATFRRTR